ncbi:MULTISPECIES: transposase [Myxococcaceae]|uniref:transposase n=1 Tax=Myxococcaceae TaxID=31 RepID=UPI00188F0A15|nr:transposase [Simulacricoccus sp. 17bor-14]
MTERAWSVSAATAPGGPLALERFERLADGRIAYRMKRAMPGGRTHLHFTGLELLRKLAALVPPPRSNLVRFHGVFAPGSKLRRGVTPVPLSEASALTAPTVHAPRVEAARRERAPRLDWAGLLQRTFALDVFLCTRCGGKRRVLSYLADPPVVRAILAHVGEATGVPPLAAAQGPPGWE